jgi:ABC-2 type transport system ATP-binding protein
MEEAYELCDEIAIMDQGKVIAQGSPASLLKAHFDAVAVVLPASDYALGAGRIGDLKAVPIREGLLEIQTTSVDHTVRAFIDAGIPLQRIRIREQTLEDLFLALTGKGLRA